MNRTQRIKIAAGAWACLGGLAIAFIGPPIAAITLMPDGSATGVPELVAHIGALQQASNLGSALSVTGLVVATLGFVYGLGVATTSFIGSSPKPSDQALPGR